jgi:hypothetical protein
MSSWTKSGAVQVAGMANGSIGRQATQPRYEGAARAIDTPRGLLVAALRATGRRVYAIKPMAVAPTASAGGPRGPKATTPRPSC